MSKFGEDLINEDNYNEVDYLSILKDKKDREDKLERDGPWEGIDPRTGDINEKGFYKNGLREGFWKTYDAENLISCVHYKDDKKNGPSEEYYYSDDEKKILSKGNYVNGFKHGHFVRYFDNTGQIQEIGEYNYGLKYGRWHEFISWEKFPNKNKDKESFYTDYSNQPYIIGQGRYGLHNRKDHTWEYHLCDKNGPIALIRKEQYEGMILFDDPVPYDDHDLSRLTSLGKTVRPKLIKVINYYPDGKKIKNELTCEGSYLASPNLLRGGYQGFFDSLVEVPIIIREVGYWENEKLEYDKNYRLLENSEIKTTFSGKSIECYESGEISSILQVSINNKSTSITKYYKNGKIKEELKYKEYKGSPHHLRSGLNKEFYENGKLKRKANYLKGILKGLEVEYDQKNKVIKEIKH